jgi:hypothetical protein
MPHYKDLNDKLHWLDDASFAHYLPNGCVEITEEEAGAMRPVYTPTYAEKRAAEYPSFADQFDLIYHGGVEAWKDVIQAVKDKYPKE